MFEVTVRIEGFDEEGQPTEALQEEIVRKVAQMVSKQCYENLAPTLEKELKKAVYAKIDSQVSEFMAQPVRRTNSYGEPKGDPITLTELIIKSGVDYLMEDVNDRGNSPSYNEQKTKRAAWIGRHSADEALRTAIKPLVEGALKEAQEYVSGRFGVEIKRAMLKAIE